jgi:hypothetical protein
MLGFGRVRPLKILSLASGQRQAVPAGFNSVRKALPLPPLVAWTGFKNDIYPDRRLSAASQTDDGTAQCALYNLAFERRHGATAQPDRER